MTRDTFNTIIKTLKKAGYIKIIQQKTPLKLVLRKNILDDDNHVKYTIDYNLNSDVYYDDLLDVEIFSGWVNISIICKKNMTITYNRQSFKGSDWIEKIETLAEQFSEVVDNFQN